MNAGLLEKPPVDVMTEALAAPCRRAGELTVALDFMPYSGVPDVATAWEVLRGADQAQRRAARRDGGGQRSSRPGRRDRQATSLM